jgi:septal ring factor EnvC (AmiA/AmiB activator)
VGEEVRGGDVVALVGDTGSLKGPCLYFEIRQRGKPLDPLAWLRK